jgi:predicted transcriptional regulator
MIRTFLCPAIAHSDCRRRHNMYQYVYPTANRPSHAPYPSVNPTPQKTHRRDKLMIVADILAALQNKEMRFTHLLYKSNLSHARLKEYLDELLAKGMVVELETKEGKRYQLADEGAKFYTEYRRVNEFVKTFGL